MHRPINPARENIAEIRSWTQSLTLWVLHALAHVAAWTRSRDLRLWVQAQAREARYTVKRQIFLLAFALLDPPRRRAGTGRKLRAPRGFRYQRRRNNVIRHFLRDVKLRTLADIKAALDDIEALATRVARRVRWRPSIGRYVLRCALCEAREAVCPAACVEAADTS